MSEEIPDNVSKVWYQTPQEAYENPYEYKIQNEFIQDARGLLKALHSKYKEYDMDFGLDDRSAKKAVWMLHMEAIDALIESFDLIERKSHRIVALLFRDVIESLDLAAYFASRTKQASKDLEKWYNDGIVANRKYRKHVRKIYGNQLAERKKNYYSFLSSITHKTYRILLQSYGVGDNDKIWFDTSGDRNKLFVLHQTIAQYLPILAVHIIRLYEDVRRFGLVEEEEIDEIWIEIIGVKFKRLKSSIEGLEG